MDVIHWLQSTTSPFLDTFWGLITDLNAGDFGLLIVAIIFWCVDVWIGWLFGNIVIVAVMANEAVKSVVLESRPGPGEVRVIREDTAPGSSFPSGHTEYATVFWGYFSWLIRRPLIWLLSGVMIILTGVSRLYLGLHWPGDIVGGFLLGVLLLGLCIWMTDSWRRTSVHHVSDLIRVGAVIVPVLAFIVVPTKVMAVSAGAGLGVNLGYLWLLPRFTGDFPIRADLKTQILKSIIGIVGILVIRLGLKQILPDLPVADFGRYAVIGLWVSWVAPAIFAALWKKKPQPAPAQNN